MKTSLLTVISVTIFFATLGVIVLGFTNDAEFETVVDKKDVVIKEDVPIVASSVSIDPPSGLSKEERKQLQIKKVLDQCNADGVTINILHKFSNSTHYIDGNVCEWESLEKYESELMPLDIASIDDGRIKLYPVGTCAGIDIDRLTPDELNRIYPATFTTKSGITYEVKFLSIDDDDLKEMPVLS